MRLCAPKPMKPLTTVAPASPRLRASSTTASYSGLPSHRSASPMKMRSSFPSVGNDIGRPQSYEPGHHLPNDVERSGGELTIARQEEALVRVGRKRREPAEDADEQERPSLGRQDESLLRQRARDAAEDHATQQIDREGPDG